MTALAAAVNVLQLFGEPTRLRLAVLLAREELTVAELVSVTELGQSSVSTHLAKLKDAGVLRDRRAGTQSFYALNDAAMPDEAKRVWALVTDRLDDALLQADRERCDKVVRARAKKENGWPDALAGQMERHYSPGRTWEALARGLLGLVRLGDVLDAGSGDGAVAQLLAPRSKSVTCLDKSERMIDAARARLSRAKNVDFRLGDLHELPFPNRSFDQVLLLNVLTHAHTPARALGEAARVLRKGGDLAVVTLDAHDHGEIGAQYGEVHHGFSPDKLRRMLQKAGLQVEQCEIACREKRPPYFETVIAFARPSGSRADSTGPHRASLVGST